MSSLNNLNYYRRSMNSIQSFDDGMGGTIQDGIITCNSFTTDTITATGINCNTLTATDINTYSLTATSGTFVDTTTSGVYVQSTINYLNALGNALYFTQKIVSNAMRFLLYSPMTSFIFYINGGDALTITATNTTVSNTLTAPTANITTANITNANITNTLTLPTANITTGNITTANISTSNIYTANISTDNILTANISTANISTTNISTANISTANISTANISNAFISDATILNSLTVPAISTTNGIFQNIQPITNSTTTNLYTNSTTKLNFAGAGATVCKTTTYPNTYLDINSQTTNQFLDFHCSNFANNFDARIIATAAGSGDSTAILGFFSKTFDVSANTNIVLASPLIDATTTTRMNFSSPTTTFRQTTLNMSSTTTNISSGTANIISSNTLNMSAPIVKLNTNTFRYVPWTTSYSGSSIATIVSVPTGGTQPTTNINTNIKYRYSIVGNTMYINFYLLQPSAGTAGSGYYQYAIPAIATYYLDNTDMQASTNGTTNGTRIGNLSFKHYGNNNALGAVYFIGSGASARLILQAEYSNAASSYKQQDNTYYHYGTVGTLYVAFEAMIPILP